MSGITLMSANPALENVFADLFGRSLTVRRIWSSQWRDPVEVAMDVCAADPELVVLGADATLEMAQLVVPEIDRLFSSATILCLVPYDDIEISLALLRLGARDVIPEAGTHREFQAAVEPVLHLARSRHRRGRQSADEVRRRVITIISPKGGSGKTTLAVNLAIGLARRVPKQVVLLDLDVQFGDCAAAMGLQPEYTLVDAVEAANHERSALKVFLSGHPSGLAVLSPPEDLVAADDIVQDQMKRTLAAFAEEFPLVIVDTASGVDRFALAAMEQSTDLLVISTTDAPSVRAVRRQLDVLDEVGYVSQRRTFVLNRANAKVGLSVAEIEAAIGLEASFQIPSTRLIPVSTNEGTPVIERSGGGNVASRFDQIAEFFAPTPDPDVRRGPAEQGQGSPMNIAELLRQSESRRPSGQGIVPNGGAAATHSDPLFRLRSRAQNALFERLGNRLFDPDMSEEQLRSHVVRQLDEILATEATQLSGDERRSLVESIGADILGLGPIEPFLSDPTVTEVMVNAADAIFIERGGRLYLTEARFMTSQHVRQLIEKIVAAVGRRIDESSPLVDARLPDGSRVNAVIPPLAVDGPMLTIRKFAKTALTAKDLIEAGTLTDDAVEFLDTSVRCGQNILISGGTGSGKTTLLNVVSSFIPANERIVTIEDAVELRLDQRHVVRLEARPANVEGKGEISIRQLLRNSLRMRPDRIVVGEVRGGEALDMLQAMNTGHDGSLTTVHSNAPRDTLARIETMVLMAGLDLPARSIREQIASALNLVVHLSRMGDGSRRVTEIAEVTGMKGDTIELSTLFAFDNRATPDRVATGGEGRRIGTLQPTGLQAQFVDGLQQNDLTVTDDLALVFPGHQVEGGRRP